MKGTIRNKYLIPVIAGVAALVCLIGLMQIRRMPSENAISGVVYESEQDPWKGSGYTLADGASMEVLAADFAGDTQVANGVKPDGAANSVAHLAAGETLTVQVEAPKAGLYRIRAEFAIPEHSTMNCMLALMQDGEYPYDDAQNIVLSQLLTVGGYPFERNKQGDEIAPLVFNEQIWQTCNLRTMSQSTTDHLLFYLNEGVNELTLRINEGEIYLSRLLFDAPAQVPTYEEYRKLYPQDQGGNACIVLEAERMNYKNSTVTRPAATRDIEAYPFESSTHLMNTVGGDTWNTNAQAIYYEFEVTQAGWYRFAMKTERSAKSTAATNTYIFRSISIDGELPFQEAGTMVLPSSGDWQINWLADEEQEYAIYLTEGTHTLGVEVNSTMLIPVSQRIRELNDQVNDISLEIRKIIGNNTDVYRDWELENYIPNLGQTLYAIADELDVLADRMTVINCNQGKNTSVTSLRICAQQMRTLAEDPDQIPNHMTLLTEGTGSVSQKLGELSESILKQPISVDQIYLVQSEGELPSYTVSPWAKLCEETAYFLSSFKGAPAENEKVIQVWVNRARNYVDLLQSMADSDFTVKTGIRVQLSVMPGEQKMILSNTNGTQPDVAMGVSCALPYQLALRGALADLRQFEGFNEVAKHFAPGSHVMHVYGDGIYALTDTQDYYVMYYRSDLMEKMGIPIPETWEEVLEILPELRRHGMNFYTPLSGNTSFKSFYATMPFIYQKGASLYTENGHAVALNSPEGLEAMRFMTDLYTIYGLPSQVGDFYQQFRSGTMPIGISSFPMFLKLDSAAAELAGKWKIALVPGFEPEDGGEITHWSTGGGTTSVIFEKSERQDEAWEFLKWWYSTEVQVEYGQQIQMLYGDEYLWNTANLEAFAQMPIDEESKAIILEQMSWLYETPQSPASYMVEREISNVWNKIVLDGENARSALDDAVIIMDQELQRKLEEFGYTKDGQYVKDYRIATVEMIEEWIGADDE